MASEWIDLAWYARRDDRSWFPVRFATLWDDGTRNSLTLYEFTSLTERRFKYGYEYLRIDTRETEPYGVEFRVVNYDAHPEKVLFQGDAWHLACWLVANTDDYGRCFNSRVAGVVPYDYKGDAP